LSVLEREGHIVSKRDGIYKRFYPKKMKAAKNRKRLTDIQKSIVDVVMDKPGISQSEISRKIKKSVQVVNYHIKILEYAGIIRLEPGKMHRTHCYIESKGPQLSPSF
jgi:predicted transcriptional regulator